MFRRETTISGGRLSVLKEQPDAGHETITMVADCSGSVVASV